MHDWCHSVEINDPTWPRYETVETRNDIRTVTVYSRRQVVITVCLWFETRVADGKHGAEQIDGQHVHLGFWEVLNVA